MGFFLGSLFHRFLEEEKQQNRFFPETDALDSELQLINSPPFGRSASNMPFTSPAVGCPHSHRT